MKKSTMAYVLAALMLSTAVIYFVAAAGESAEAGEGQDKEQVPASNRDSGNGQAINSATEQEGLEEGSEGAEGVGEEEGGLATQVQTVFFTVVGLGYAGVGAWILKDKGKTNAPYIIAIGGSVAIIGLYVASRTVSLPVVGLQDDVGTIDILSKVLQVGIIGLAAYMVNSNKITKPLPNRQEYRK
jgi:hypothetical protein